MPGPDRLGIASLSGLRSLLGLQHDIVDVFANWFGSKPGYLLIDALDTARGTRAADALRELIQQVVGVQSRWHVIASIRKFDLRYSSNLQEVFPVNGHNVDRLFNDSEFPFVRHINMPLLSDEELGQLEAKAPLLYDLYKGASDRLRKLLHVPFNLRLAASLLGNGMRREEFAPIQTQIDLLNRYWSRRVIDETGGDDREAVLRLALTGMVSMRRLQADRQCCAVSGLTSALDQLLSRHVLTEWQPSPTAAPDRRSIAFEHNFLFDFALAKLYLPADNSSLIEMLEKDPDAITLLRPSLALRSQELWFSGPQKFWQFALDFSRAGNLSYLAQMTPMNTVAENAREISSLEPLVSALDASSPEDAKAGRRALRHLVGSLKSGRSENKPFIGANAGPWCELLERITRVPKPELANLCQALIAQALEFKDHLSKEQFDHVGLAARRVLDMVWQAERRNGQMIIHSLRSVASTFVSDRKESALRIRRALTPERVREYGYEEVHWLAHEVKTLIFLDPELTADIYIAAFEWTETDESATPLSHSQILPLVSNKRQDSEQTRWLLGQHYPNFAKRAPITAARVMIAMIEAYGLDKQRENDKWSQEIRKRMATGDPIDEAVEALFDGELDSSDETLHRFQVDGHAARLMEDRFGIGEGGVSSQDEAIQILGTFFRHLEDLAGQDEQVALTSQIIVYVIENNLQPIVWRRLLELISRHQRLTLQFKTLADAEPLMLASETCEQFGSFLHTLHPLLLATERHALEERILSFADTNEASNNETAVRRGDQILKALGDLELSTEEAKSRLAAIRRAESERIEREIAQFGFRQLMPDEVDSMHRRGENPAEFDARQSIEPLTTPVEQFGSRHFNTVPSLEESEGLLAGMQELLALVEGPDDALPDSLRDAVIAGLTGACSQIAKIESLDRSTDLGSFVRKVLLASASSSYPPADPEGSQESAAGTSAGWPVTRVVATEGLLALAAAPGCENSEILQALERLLTDKSAKVRYPIARYSLWLHKSNPAKMWEWVQGLSTDKSLSVRAGCAHALDYLGNLDAERALGLIDAILTGAPRQGEEAHELTRYCVQALTGWYVRRNVVAARSALDRIISDVPEYANQAISIPFMLRDLLNSGAMNEEGEVAATRHRAVDLFTKLSKHTCQAVHQSLAEDGRDSQSSPDRESKTRSLVNLTNTVGAELYFASGAHQPGRENLPAVITQPEQTRLYWELTSIFDDLSEFGFPATAQHFIETLEMYIDTDPRSVFLRLDSTVKAGKSWNYEYEDMAQSLVLRIVRRYLADRRSLLQEDQKCQRALRELVETFIEAGWPSAQYLAYRIDEIHR